jgi:hypothetical protein
MKIEELETIPQVVHDQSLGGYVYPKEYQDKVFKISNNKDKYFIFKDGKPISIDRNLVDAFLPVIQAEIQEGLIDKDIRADVLEYVDAFIESVDNKLNKFGFTLDDLSKQVSKIKLELDDIKSKTNGLDIEEQIRSKIENFSDDVFSKMKLLKEQLEDTNDAPRPTEGLTISKLVMLREAGFKPKEIIDLAQFLK